MVVRRIEDESDYLQDPWEEEQLHLTLEEQRKLIGKAGVVVLLVEIYTSVSELFSLPKIGFNSHNLTHEWSVLISSYEWDVLWRVN